MDKNRREFVKFIALLAAGAAALPQQIEAYTKYYDANTPLTGGPFIAMDEVWMSGLATKSTRVRMTLFHQDRSEYTWSFNAFGGVVRWVAAPDMKLVAIEKDLKWRLELFDGRPDYRAGDDWVRQTMNGYISYIDDMGRRRQMTLTKPTGTLAGVPFPTRLNQS